MKILFLLAAILIGSNSYSQVFCVKCVNQVTVLNPNAVNMLINGSFESSSCIADDPFSSFNPASSAYNCDINNWTCSGGGYDTRSYILDTFYNTVPDGDKIVYLNNSICNPCSSAFNDISCIEFS